MKTLEAMAQSPKDNFPEYLIIHHFGGTDQNPLSDSSNQTFKVVQDYHISLGWENIGYHYVIEKLGKIVPGRPEHYHGAHTSEQDMNKRSLGIALAGNFDATLPTKEQEQALAGLLATLKGKYSVPAEKIVPHRHFTIKTCYGRKLADDWARNLSSIPVVDKEKVKQDIIKLLNTL